MTASADGSARVYNTMTGACLAILTGHAGEISKVNVYRCMHAHARLQAGKFSAADRWRSTLKARKSSLPAATRLAVSGARTRASAYKFSKGTLTKFSHVHLTTRAIRLSQVRWNAQSSHVLPANRVEKRALLLFFFFNARAGW